MLQKSFVTILHADIPLTVHAFLVLVHLTILSPWRQIKIKLAHFCQRDAKEGVKDSLASSSWFSSENL